MFRTGRAPGLEVTVTGRGCNRIFGKFSINQIETDDTGEVTVLDATFVQQCESSTAPLLKGAIKVSARPLSFTAQGDRPGDPIGGGPPKTYRGADSIFSLTGGRRGLQYDVSGRQDD